MHFALRTVGKDWSFLTTAVSMVPFLVKDLVLAVVASMVAVRLIPVARKAPRI